MTSDLHTQARFIYNEKRKQKKRVQYSVDIYTIPSIKLFHAIGRFISQSNKIMAMLWLAVCVVSFSCVTFSQGATEYSMVTSCGGTFHLNESNPLMTVRSPSYVDSSPCRWVFTSPPKTRIVLRIIGVVLEKGTVFRVYEDEDSGVVYARYADYSSAWGVHHVRMEGNRGYASLEKSLPGPIGHGAGFVLRAFFQPEELASWEAEEEPLKECGGALTLTRSSYYLDIITPEYPSLTGPGEIDCTWVVTSSSGSPVQLVYADVALHAARMRSFEGATTNASAVIQVLTPTSGDPLTPVPSSGDVMTISFTYSAVSGVNSSWDPSKVRFYVVGDFVDYQTRDIIIGLLAVSACFLIILAISIVYTVLFKYR